MGFSLGENQQRPVGEVVGSRVIEVGVADILDEGGTWGQGLLDLLPGRRYGGWGGPGAVKAGLKGGELPVHGRNPGLIFVTEEEVIKFALLLLTLPAELGKFRIPGGVLLLGKEAVDHASLGPENGLCNEGRVSPEGTGKVEQLVFPEPVQTGTFSAEGDDVIEELESLGGEFPGFCGDFLPGGVREEKRLKVVVSDLDISLVAGSHGSPVELHRSLIGCEGLLVVAQLPVRGCQVGMVGSKEARGASQLFAGEIERFPEQGPGSFIVPAGQFELAEIGEMRGELKGIVRGFFQFP